MKRLDEPVTDILSELGEAAVNQDWDRAETELDLLSEEIVEALIERRDDDIRQTAETVEHLYAGLAAALGGAAPPRQAMLVGQLRAVTGLLMVALRHRRAPDAEHVLRDTANACILAALQAGALSNREIARVTEYSEETVARKLPPLRTAGLVESRKSGRAMMNQLTKAGYQVVGQERMKRDSERWGFLERLKRSHATAAADEAAKATAEHSDDKRPVVTRIPLSATRAARGR